MTVADMPAAQVRAVAECLERLRADGVDAVWHPNPCGCCIAVHANVAHPTGGYVIGRDGSGAGEWLDVDAL